MTDLKADLTELSDALPHLPDEVNGLSQSAHDLADAAATLLNEVAATRQEVSSLLTHVQNNLPGFTVQVESLEKGLETSLANAEKAWADGHGQLGDGEHALETAGDHANTARTDLMRALSEAGTKVDQASADGDAAITRIESIASDGHDRIKAAAGQVTEQVGTLRALLEKTKDSLEEAGQDLLDRVKLFIDNANFDTGVILDHLRHRMGQYTGHLEEIAKEEESQTETIVLALETRIKDAVSGPVGLAGENARIAVERLAASASTQQEAVVKALGGHNEAVGDLKEAAAPMPDGVQQIHEAVVRMRQQ